MGNVSPAMKNDKGKSLLVEVYEQYPFELERGKDIYVWDSKGKRYLDFYGGHAVCILGHSPDVVVDAIEKQARKFMFYSNLARIGIREQAAAALLRFAGEPDASVFFCNSGAEANENALKVAIKNTGRSKVIGFSGGFHGRTLLAIGATDKPSWHEYLGKWIAETEHIRPNELEDLQAIDSQTAAVILEPIQSIGGVVEFSGSYLSQLRKRCDEVGAYLIFDEVQTGMGRTARPFVSGFSGVNPDMFTLAKGLAAGFPIGAVVMKRAVVDKLKTGDIAATFGGGPMAMAAVIATVETIEEKGLVEHVGDIDEYVREIFQEPEIVEVKGRGCLLGLRLKKKAAEVQQELFERGFITGLCSDPEVLHLLPPLTVEKEHLDLLKSALLAVLRN